MNIKNIEVIFIIFLILLGIYYIYSASKTQMLGEDEANYMKMARSFFDSEYPQLDRFNRQLSFPPFISLLMSSFFFSFGEFLEIGKVLVAIFGFLTVLMVYLIAKKENILAGICSSILLLSIPAFTHSMFLLYLEVPIAFFSALSIYLFLSMKSLRNAILLGAVLGISIYVKASGAFLIYALFLYTIISFILKKDKNLLKLITVAVIVSALIITPWLIKNIIFYKYPYVEGLNYLFSVPKTQVPEWVSKVTSELSPPIDYNFYFGYLLLLLVSLGSTYAFYSRNKYVTLSIFMVIIFFSAYFIRSITGVEPRYLSIIFPQISIIGGIYLSKVFYEFKNKSHFRIITLIIIGSILIWSVFSSYTTADGTVNSTRYTPTYVESLKWIKDNTPKDSVIFTPLGGSVIQFSDRDPFWSNTMDEFPELMTTYNPTRVYDILKKYNVSYVLIWRNVVAQSYIVPGSNFLGLFTYNFVNSLNSDQNQTIFKPVFSNQDTIIFELI